MSDFTFGRKKTTTSTFSNPSLVSLHIPTLANPVRGFGLPTNNVIETATKESTNQLQGQSAGEQSLEQQLIKLRPCGHDISRIAFRRPQTKLTVGEPGDKYEQEADRVANQVMRMVVLDKFNAPSVHPVQDSLQHKCTACEREEEKVQTKPSIQPATDGGLQGEDNIESQLNSSKGGGSPLPDEVRSFMEPRFGADFSSVRVHTGSEAVQMNQKLGAQAFTHGHDIYFGSGKYNSRSSNGKQLLAHELTHVVQQTGRVQLKQDSVLMLKETGDTQTKNNVDCSDPSLIPVGGMDSIQGVRVWQIAEKFIEYLYRQKFTGNTISSQKEWMTLIGKKGAEQEALTCLKGGESGPNFSAKSGMYAGEPDIWDFTNRTMYEITTQNGSAERIAKLGWELDLANAITLSEECGGISFDRGNWVPDPNCLILQDDLYIEINNNQGVIIYQVKKRVQPKNQPEPIPIPVSLPVPSQRQDQQQNEPQRQPVSASKVLEVLAALGLSILLVATVIAALADPEPASKLLLAGLTLEEATEVLSMLGISTAASDSFAW